MSRETFSRAAELFVSTVNTIPTNMWALPGLGVWTVRDLVGHMCRSILLVEDYATASPGKRSGFGNSDDIARWGREAGQKLGDEPNSVVREIVDRVLSLIGSLSDDHILHLPTGKWTLSEYLRSRVCELTVHSIDVARAIGVNTPIPDECMHMTLHFYADSAIRQRKEKDLLLTLTGRKSLPKNFSLLSI